MTRATPPASPPAQTEAAAPTPRTAEAQGGGQRPEVGETAVMQRPEQQAPDRAGIADAMRQVRTMAAPYMAGGRLTAAEVDSALDDVVAGTLNVDQAASRFMAAMAAAEAPGPRSSGAVIRRDETDVRMQGMIGALAGEHEGPAEQFRGLRLRSLAMELAGRNRGFNDADAIRRGMLSTTMMGGALGVSDFSYITTEVMNRRLLAAYQRRSASWAAVTGTPLSASDFRELSAVRFGGDFQLKPVAENGEYQQATLADEAEGLKVERRGRTITITFEAIVNDDMGAFQRIPGEFAMAARIMEASMVWSLIRNNAALKSDSLPLFQTAKHGNLASAGGAISAATVGAARKAMWEQRAFGSKDADDFLMIEPDRLLVPPALELEAGQFVASVTPSRDADANPFKSSITPVVASHLGAAAGGSDTAWYLISSDLPPIAHAYLDGYEAPTVQTIEGMNPDAVKMNARHIFGAAAVEYRGAYKNPGA